MDIVEVPLEQLIRYARNPRRNENVVATVATSLATFGWRQPNVVDEEMVILAGHTRLEAARRLGPATAPVNIAGLDAGTGARLPADGQLSARGRRVGRGAARPRVQGAAGRGVRPRTHRLLRRRARPHAGRGAGGGPSRTQAARRR